MTERLQALADQLGRSMLVDRHRLRSRLHRLRRGGKAGGPEFEALAAEIAASCARFAAREERRPRPEYPEELPVSARRGEIIEAIREHQVVVVAGETGSGKTTQLPKICLEAGRGIGGVIGHTQPRRIAARSVAMRIAGELKGELGHAVGYKVRFSDRVSPDGYIKLMTDGILLAEMQGDRWLNQYDTLIIDEAHERSLNIDFLLGYLRQLLPRRPDLKLVITSATIDTARFAEHFGAPVIEVSGRTYPVEMRYRPLLGEDADDIDRDQTGAILDAVDELSREGPGDVLVFLPGEREIRETAEALRKHHPPHTEILPLFARLAAGEQNRVFAPHGGRRIVLATNVAETSLTVPGIRYVVDPGYARMSRYSYRAKVQRLPIEKVSQASANQRAGRCGRVGPGICIRLYDETDFLNRPEFTDPEIRRTNLAAVILQMQALGLGEVEAFPFLEPPDSRFVTDGYKLLHELGAVDERRRLSKLGRQLARLPVDPRIGRMLLAAEREGSLNEALVIAAALSIQDPRERPAEARDKADNAQAEFRDERSDFLAYLKLWNAFEAQRTHLSQNKQRGWCRERFLSYVRMREWREVHNQLHQLAAELKLRANQTEAGFDEIHRALLTGLLGNIGFRDEAHSFLGARNSRFNVFPGSGLFKKPPKWLMAGELIETTRLYAHTVAGIKPEWVEELGGHLVKRSYSEPHWEQRAAQVAATERVTLYGLTVNPGRRVNYGPINPVEARELFIRGALVEGEYQTKAPFFKHNRELLASIEALEHKQRRRDVLVDEEELYAFYDARIPAGIYSGAQFEQWRREAEKSDPKALFLTREALMRHEAEGVTAGLFPESLTADGLVYPLDYHFEPGHPADGVTLVIPLAALNQAPEARAEWLVPGLIEEKLAALIRSLPKSLRRNFVPAPDFARAAAGRLEFGRGALLEQLAHQLLRMTGVEVPPDAWQPQVLAPHLRMNFRVVDNRGKPLGEERDLATLRARLSGRARESFAGVVENRWERNGLTEWSCGELPEVVEFTRQGLTLRGYPALVDAGDAVDLKLFDDPDEALASHRLGLRRLAMRVLAKEVKYLHKNLPGIDRMCLHYAPVGKCEALRGELVAAAVDRALVVEPLPRDAAAFAARTEEGRKRLVEEGNALSRDVGAALAEYHAVAKRLKGALPPTWLEAVRDIREQLDRLVYPGFVAATPPEVLPQLARYLKAIGVRLEKLSGRLQKDRQAALEVKALWQAWAERTADGKRGGPEWTEFRWLLEELRVSLFAQELKTRVPVSAARLGKRLAELGKA